MNSVLQVLAHLGPFTAHLLELPEPVKAGRARSSSPEVRSPANKDIRALRPVAEEVHGGPNLEVDKPKVLTNLRDLLRTLWQEPQDMPVNPGRLHVALMR